MGNFIEQLYYGNINPQERFCRKGSEAHKIEDRVSALEDEVRSCLSGDALHAFDDFCKAQLDLLSVSDLDAFITGFRLGARMTVDTFCSDAAPFEQMEE